MSTPLDYLGDCMQRADSGDADATRSLLEQAADHLCAGQIEDLRLRMWLVDYLAKHIADLPGPKGRPDKTIEHFEMCVLVERMHIDGVPIAKAIEGVAELADVTIKASTIKRQHEKYRNAARKKARYLIARAADWNSLLDTTLSSPCFDRPFVCEGFPSESQVIVIGENPATPMSVDWWTYWSRETGFNYEKFLAAYKTERSKIGKRISHTKLRLDRIREGGVRCVETNVFQNENPNGAGTGSPNFEILNLLILYMPKLRAIVAHGKKAEEFLKQANVPDDIRQITTKHFRFVSYNDIDKICRELLADA